MWNICLSTKLQYFSPSTFFLQSWGDFTDVSQAIFMYVMMMGNVYVFCSLGTAVSDQVIDMKLSFMKNTGR
jgi:hypothetical protein